MQKDAGKAATDAHIDAPVSAAKQQKNQELIPPVPSNTHDEQPIQPEKVRPRLFTDTPFNQQEPEAAPSASVPVKLKRETNDIQDSAEEAIQ